ncbi:MAG TPA: hypothetical protein PKY10_11240, partial [Lentisphaeria bacterium]|nr:hypothetical protein [Lentisphaeria bacterium]
MTSTKRQSALFIVYCFKVVIAMPQTVEIGTRGEKREARVSLDYVVCYVYIVFRVDYAVHSLFFNHEKHERTRKFLFGNQSLIDTR